jgi:hypothetical protein
MSQLRDKILSYPVETYFPMEGTPTYTNPEILGTYLPTGTPFMNNGGSGALPIYEPTENPIGADGGSWRFNQPTQNAARYMRTNSIYYGNQKVWDGQYGFGIWVRFNSFPTGTTTASYTFFATARTNSFPGFSLSLRGTTHTSGVGVMHNFFSSSTPILVPQLNTWYYIVGRKNKSTSGATIWVNGVKVATGTNTTGVEPVTSTETTYQIAFGTSGTATAASSYSYNLSHAHLMDFTTFTDAAIADIYQAGSTAPSLRTVRYFNGTAWVDSVGQKVWNGTAWVDWNAKRFDGSTWINV